MELGRRSPVNSRSKWPSVHRGEKLPTSDSHAPAHVLLELLLCEALRAANALALERELLVPDLPHGPLREDLLEVQGRDLPVPVDVEDGEGCVHEVPLAADADAERRGDELGPLDGAAVVLVQCVDNPLHLQGGHAGVSQDLPQGYHAEGTSVVHVEVREDLTQLRQHRLGALVGDEEEDGLLQLRLAGVGVQALRDAHRQRRGRLREHLEPRMLEAGGGVRPRVGVLQQHLLQQALAQGRDRAVHELAVRAERVLADGPLQLALPPVHVFARWQRPGSHEGVIASDEVVQDATSAPDVHLRRELEPEDLWGHVQEGASEVLRNGLVGLEELGQAKVDDFDRGGVFVTEHDVLRLQILVHEALAVHEGERPERLLHDVADEGLAEARLALLEDVVDPVLQLPTVARLHDLGDAVLVFEVLVHLDHVGVVEHGHALDLRHDLLGRHA
mmetsp:Transcript_22602/g.64137  ORF Transcript_22602/g.64137 Transcript_22602/m.64137 type:complete len:446 (+) Transcript_22602:1-1338(+)